MPWDFDMINMKPKFFKIAWEMKSEKPSECIHINACLKNDADP